MKKEEAMEGATATLRCELNKAGPVEWRKGPETLRARDRVSLRQDGAVCELEIRDLVVADAGEYSCVCGQEKTSSTLTVRGKDPCGQAELYFVVQLLISWHHPALILPTFLVSVLPSSHNSTELLPPSGLLCEPQATSI